MCEDIINIAKLKDPLGIILDTKIRPNGLKISKVTVPLGLIAVIFESSQMLLLTWPHFVSSQEMELF